MAVSKGFANYTTTIDPGKSAIECIELLTKHGATHIGIAVGENKVPDGLEFVIRTPYGPRHYSLTVNVKGTREALVRAWREHRVERRHTDPAQAARVAWRVLRDWLEYQLALVDTGMADLPQVMLPWLKVDENRTLYAAWQDNELRALEAGSGGAS